MDRIALVNSNDEIVGYEEKLKVHKLGLLHRAFSILVFNDSGEVLIHQRAWQKYHSPGLFTNTCCSHLPQNAEWSSVIHQRLNFEMGFDCDLSFAGTFHYKAEFNNALIENEIDHVYIGRYNGTPNPNPDEVSAYHWITLNVLENNLKLNPTQFTVWLPYVLKTAKGQISEFFTE
jgi:isopentenyl-diphosphate delta-isomerase